MMGIALNQDAQNPDQGVFIERTAIGDSSAGGYDNIFLDHEDLFSILENYENDTSFEDLIKELSLLKEDFSEVEISYEAGEPDMIEDENGMLVVIQNEKSIVHITDDQLIKIIKKTEEIRNRFINL